MTSDECERLKSAEWHAQEAERREGVMRQEADAAVLKLEHAIKRAQEAEADTAALSWKLQQISEDSEDELTRIVAAEAIEGKPGDAGRALLERHAAELAAKDEAHTATRDERNKWHQKHAEVTAEMTWLRAERDDARAQLAKAEEENARLRASNGLVCCSKHGENVFNAGCILCADEERTEKNAALVRAEEENARLRDARAADGLTLGNAQAALGRAVAALEKAEQLSVNRSVKGEYRVYGVPASVRDVILADPTNAAAGEAWTAAQALADEATKTDYTTPQNIRRMNIDDAVKRLCEAIATVTARRGA